FVGGHGTFHATRQGKPWPASIREGASGTHPDCVCRRKGQAGCTPQRACGLTVRSTRTAPPPLNSSVSFQKKYGRNLCIHLFLLWAAAGGLAQLRVQGSNALRRALG